MNNSIYTSNGFTGNMALHMTAIGEMLRDIAWDGRVDMNRIQVETVGDCATVITLDLDAPEGRCVIINGENAGEAYAAHILDCTSPNGFILGDVIAGHLQDVAAAQAVQAA